jgi:hypothetical protein
MARVPGVLLEVLAVERIRPASGKRVGKEGENP